MNSKEEGEEIVIHEGEIKDANQIFEMAWNNLAKVRGDEYMAFPKEILFLAGAPGAGKGEMVNYIKQLRGITTETIEISKILKSSEAEKVKASGGLVASRHVVQLLLQNLLENKFRDGVVIDGFPRTKVQGECIKLLYDKMIEYNNKYDNTIHANRFNRPFFKITVLFVEEELSIQRQLSRGEKVRKHNRRVTETGFGTLIPERKTDTDKMLARMRYRQFKEHVYESLRSVKNFFNFHFILADDTPDVVKARILKELKYQSSSELQQKTFDFVRQLPLASEVVKGARLNLVERLEDYQRNHSILFKESITGRVVIRTEDELFRKKYALRMALDLFTERGFKVSLEVIKF